MVCVHMEDMLSVAPDDKARQPLERTLDGAFEIKKQQQGRVLSYLGMTIRSEPDDCISMAQPGFAAADGARSALFSLPPSAPSPCCC
jgi:hypothetical protein